MIILKENINKDLIQYKGINFVYLIKVKQVIVYVGCSQNIYKRFKEHKYQKNFDSILLIKCCSFIESRELERDMIYKHKPEQNTFGVNKPVPLLDQYPKKKNHKQEKPVFDLKSIHSSILRR